MKRFILIIFISFISLFLSAIDDHSVVNNNGPNVYPDGRPYTRWWWHAMKFTKKDIENQLVWLRDQGFGGVEIAFIYPVNRNPAGERFEWLGKEWQEMVVYAKHCADSLGMGCDFTYGTLWPFGGTFVSDDDRTRVCSDSSFKQPLRLSWTHPDTGNVLNHMDMEAFKRYAEVMSQAFEPAMKGSRSALFCDSWEVETHKLWTPGFEKKFEEKFGYDIMPYMNRIYDTGNEGPRHDYMKLVADLVLNEFYIPFNEESHKLGGFSRVQAAGSPTDLIRAYAVMDVPETEAMLYNPGYSRIVASSAALGRKPVVSSETFTCLYGWPAKYMFHEQTADLKMVADALFANGVNFHIWHGTPFNPTSVDTIFFYATVHVGKKGSLTNELLPFNEYLTKVSHALRFGQTYSDIAVYLPLEDSWIEGVLPDELKLPWSWGAYELRYKYIPDELEGYHPLWINADFLRKAEVKDQSMKVNDMTFQALYVDVSFLDSESLDAIFRVAKEGLPVYIINIPLQAGLIKDARFNEKVQDLLQLGNVFREFSEERDVKPLVEGEDLPEFWARTDGNELKLFFSNPACKDLKYPLAYGQSFQEEVISQNVKINFNGHNIPVELHFKPYQSVLIHIDSSGRWKYEDIEFYPEEPDRKMKKEK